MKEKIKSDEIRKARNHIKHIDRKLSRGQFDEDEVEEMSAKFKLKKIKKKELT